MKRESLLLKCYCQNFGSLYFCEISSDWHLYPFSCKISFLSIQMLSCRKFLKKASNLSWAINKSLKILSNVFTCLALNNSWLSLFYSNTIVKPFLLPRKRIFKIIRLNVLFDKGTEIRIKIFIAARQLFLLNRKKKL